MRSPLRLYLYELVGDSPPDQPDEDVSQDAYRRTKGRCPPGGQWNDKTQTCYPTGFSPNQKNKVTMPQNQESLPENPEMQEPEGQQGENPEKHHFIELAQALDKADGNNILEVADSSQIEYRLSPHRRNDKLGYTVHLVGTPFSFALPSHSTQDAANAYARLSILKAALYLSDGYPQDSMGQEQLIQEIEQEAQVNLHHDSPVALGGDEQEPEEEEEPKDAEEGYQTPDELSDQVPSIMGGGSVNSSYSYS